ncbi:hypothetical protein LSCM1_03718 [Leishmania martiniquensis]|uniref:Histone-binding protein RBBP4-like N-terminal domain-containing protein n=1 Tax=Leishmania martiniquensis TaxID=1580590 RepID=A0A836GEZ6_9TRYP|nr:hypothetical protein LSCM1_03718 [Leishmania martiniquensis]
MIRAPDINSEKMQENDSRTDGPVNSAVGASSFPRLPSMQWSGERPPPTAPPAGQIPRVQALARWPRGEDGGTKAKSLFAAANDVGQSGLLEAHWDCAVGGAKWHTEPETLDLGAPLHAAVPLATNTCAAAHVTALHEEGSRHPESTTDDVSGTGAVRQEMSLPQHRGGRRHSHGTERANGVPGGGADSVCDDDSEDDDSKSTSTARSRSAEGANTAPPSASPVDGGAQRCVASTRQAANALPRMLALQRSFEAEARHLYEYCGMHVVEWPTLAVEWIPDRTFIDPERDYTLQYLAIGAQVHPLSEATNTVKLMEVAVPVAAAREAMHGAYGDDDVAKAGPADPEGAENLDPGKRFANIKGHFRCEQTLTVDAPVLKIRAMPAETNIIAVKTASAFIGVYNLVQELTEDEAGRTVPDALLRGHRRGGFGLCWNTLKPGFIASAADDGYVNYYDVSHRLTIDMREAPAVDPVLSVPQTPPLERLVGHRDIVTDCSWHASQGHLLTSSSMDGDVRLWDIRMRIGGATIYSAHASGATAAQFHPICTFQLATTGAEGSVSLWDIRHTAEPVRELNYHGRAITGLQWSPFSETVMLSYGADGRVVLWDLAKTSLPLDYSKSQVAPPEVSFVHIGHVGRVTDASWSSSKAEEWLVASADTTNGLQVYRPRRDVVQEYRAYEE